MIINNFHTIYFDKHTLKGEFMSSLETIKQELIKQKTLLENKGFEVPISSRNPSPTDISNAISNINLNFAETTATEQDVRAGKTFISQTQGIRTGTLDTSDIDPILQTIDRMISGIGDNIDISTIISPNITEIKSYAFRIETDASNRRIFYAYDFILPTNIKCVRQYAFSYTCLWGKVTIPDTCVRIYTYAFSNGAMSEIEVNSGLDSSSNYAFGNCKSLKKITFGPKISVFTTYLLSYCTALEEVVVKTSLPTWKRYFIHNTSSVKRIIFETPQPCPVDSGGFYNVYSASLLVPYEYYDTYFNATNYQQYSNPMYGYGYFSIGATFPSTQGSYNIVWYSTLDDLLADTNPVTECTSTDRYYGKFTEIVDTETTE